MHLKRQINYPDLVFLMDSPDGKGSFPIPKEGRASSLSQLTEMVIKQMEEFDEQGHDYTSKAKSLADGKNMDFHSYMMKSIEHQICKRHPNDCYKDGWTDTLHFGVAVAIDKKISNMSPTAQKIAKAAVRAVTRLATGTSSNSLSGCSTCGGTKSYNPRVNNLGRAGSFNNYVPSSLPKKRK